MDGILLINKPPGWTSHDVVAKVRSLLGQATGQKIKVGHTGTLDPMATGLMILVIGSYTKRAAEFSKLDKTYGAELSLGATSSTADAEGEIVQQSKKVPTQGEVEQVLESFTGEIEQIPPIFSAIKVNGQRAYKLARAGTEVKLESRRVKINSLLLTEYAYPKLKFTADVSSGTYIRSLAVDIGENLGTGAYLSALKRTIVGNYSLDEAFDLEDLNLQSIANNLLD
jgi:tRNA pseudouridine55 synthase